MHLRVIRGLLKYASDVRASIGRGHDSCSAINSSTRGALDALNALNLRDETESLEESVDSITDENASVVTSTRAASDSDTSVASMPSATGMGETPTPCG